MLLSDHVWVKPYRDVRCDLIGRGWVSFQDTENEVEERKSEVHKVLSTGRRVMTELNFGKLLTILAYCKLYQQFTYWSSGFLMDVCHLYWCV